MVDWQITAKTIYCEAVDDEVTLLIYKDGSSKCTGTRKYGEPTHVTRDLVTEKSKRLKRELKCESTVCRRLVQYKETLFTGENEG